MVEILDDFEVDTYVADWMDNFLQTCMYDDPTAFLSIGVE